MARKRKKGPSQADNLPSHENENPSSEVDAASNPADLLEMEDLDLEDDPEDQVVPMDERPPESAMTTAILDPLIWMPPSAVASEPEYVEPTRYRGDDSPYGKRVRNLRCTSGAPTGFCGITVTPTEIYEVELERGLGRVPQRVADVIQREGGPWKLL